MRRKDKEITNVNDKIAIISKCKACRLGLSENNYPYIVPLNYGYTYINEKLTLFFHGAKEGRKIDIIKNNNNACFEIDCDTKLIEAEKPFNYGYEFKKFKISLIIFLGGVFISCTSIRDHFVRNMLNDWEERDNKILSEQTLPENIIKILDIPYIADGHRGHLLDIYYQANMEGPFPAIIDLHGDGFFYGYKEMNKLYDFHLVKNGFIVFNINYRLAFNDAKVPDQIQDAIDALNWIDNNLDSYPVDKDKIYLIGESAGAYLATMAVLISENQRLQDIFNIGKSNLKINAMAIISGFMEWTRNEFKYWGMRSMILEKIMWSINFIIWKRTGKEN